MVVTSGKRGKEIGFGKVTQSDSTVFVKIFLVVLPDVLSENMKIIKVCCYTNIYFYYFRLFCMFKIFHNKNILQMYNMDLKYHGEQSSFTLNFTSRPKRLDDTIIYVKKCHEI